MKTAPPSRNRRAGMSRPRAAGGSGKSASGRQGTTRDAARAETPTAHAAAARHSAEAERVETAQPQPERAAFLLSFVYAWNGIVYTVRTQRNMRVHLALAVLAVALGIWLRISPVEFAMVFVAITLVVVSEMINTVVEACVDLATQQYHPLARVAKDVAAGAVLLCAMLAVVIGCLVYLPHLWSLVMRLIGR